jgi:CRP-like cAMP-binding protein
MNLPIPGIPIDTKLLAALPRGQMDLLAPLASTRQLAQGVVLLEAGEELDQVFFPHSGMLSLIMVLDDGNAIEVGTVGRERVVGAMAGLGLYKSSVRVVVQLPAAVTQIGAAPFRKAIEGSVAMRNFCRDYNEVLLLQARVTAACNAVHPLEASSAAGYFIRPIARKAIRCD